MTLGSCPGGGIKKRRKDYARFKRPSNIVPNTASLPSPWKLSVLAFLHVVATRRREVPSIRLVVHAPRQHADVGQIHRTAVARLQQGDHVGIGCALRRQV